MRFFPHRVMAVEIPSDNYRVGSAEKFGHVCHIAVTFGGVSRDEIKIAVVSREDADADGFYGVV